MTDNKALVEQFFENERSLRRRAVVMMWVAVVVIDAAAIVAYLRGVAIDTLARGLAVAAAGSAFMMFLNLRRRTTLQARLTNLLDSIEFGWDELNGLDLNEAEAEHLQVAFSATAGRITTNEAQLRTRGGDEKGPAFDRHVPSMEASKERVDPALHEDDYVGLEGDLRVAEILVEEANQQKAEEAHRQWAAAEARDMDNIEAGVKRLGDLVASGWFEQNAEDGALANLMESRDQRDA